MLKGLSGRYEAHHGIKYSPEALKAAAHLSDRYVSDRFLPDKAIDLMDEAAAKLMRSLYEGISESGMSKAEALRQAQLTLLEDPSYSDPFFWSAYTLVGNWR